MASGKKNYFRHSFFASEDPKIQFVISTMGYEGYGFYFSLLELCGRQCAGELRNPIVFHIETIRKVWRKNTESSKKVLRKLEESGLFVVTFSEHFVSVDIPSFEKYLGKYESNAPNKKKEKEKKEKEIKSAEESASVDVGPKKILPDVKHEENLKPTLFAPEAPALEEETSLSDLERNALTALNSICGKSFRPTPGNMKFIKARIKEGYNFEDFVKVIKFKFGQWGNDPKFRTFLRPETIFGTKFDSYLAEASDDRLKAIEADRLIREFFPGFTA